MASQRGHNPLIIKQKMNYFKSLLIYLQNIEFLEEKRKIKLENNPSYLKETCTQRRKIEDRPHKWSLDCFFYLT